MKIARKLSLHKETLRSLSTEDLSEVQGGCKGRGHTVNQYTCNGSVGIACTAINCLTVNQQACMASGVIPCAAL